MTDRQTFSERHEPGMAQDSSLKTLTLHNDNKNSFDHVILSLVTECKHGNHQAEQCALIAHFKGKCDIMQGSLSELLPVYSNLIGNDLTVTID